MIKIKQWLKICILFLIGGFIYVAIELGFRGHSHWTMFLLGGLCFILIGGLNNYIPWEMSLIKQGLIGALIVTSLEFIFGLIFNLYFNLGIWDYSNMPFNILGQICLPFSIAWFFLSLVAIFVDDWLRYILFKEGKPHYHLFTVCKEENK